LRARVLEPGRDHGSHMLVERLWCEGVRFSTDVVPDVFTCDANEILDLGDAGLLLGHHPLANHLVDLPHIPFNRVLAHEVHDVVDLPI